MSYTRAFGHFTDQPIGAVVPIIRDPNPDDMDDTARDDISLYVKRAPDEWERWPYPFTEAAETVRTLKVAVLAITTGGEGVVLHAQGEQLPALFKHFRMTYDNALKKFPHAAVTEGDSA